jgi:hypothetical protein
MKLFNIHCLIFSLILSVVYFSPVGAVTEAELEALEKELEHQETKAKEQAEAEAKSKAALDAEKKRQLEIKRQRQQEKKS